MKLRVIPVVVCFISLGGCSPPGDDAVSSIEGVWKVVRIERDDESPPNTEPLPSQIIFTNRHYSVVWMPGSEATKAFATRWQPTDEEKIRRFGELVVNTGTYEIEDDTIVTRPNIARFPEFIGGKMVYRYEWSGERLIFTLIDEYTFDGVQAPWVPEFSGKVHISLARIAD